MIYGEKFIYLHLGKTGGTTISFWASLCPEFVQHRDADSMDEKHLKLSYQQNRFPNIDFSTKEVILGFRNIESWILSHNNFKRIGHPNLLPENEWITKTREGLVCTARRHNMWVAPDQYLKPYITNTKIKHFIRTEYIREDFIKVFKNYGLVEDKKIKNITKNSRSYWKPISFTQQEKQKIYKDNPLWMNIQKKLYI